MIFVFVLYFFTRLVNIKGVPVFCDEATYTNWARAALKGNLWAELLYDGKPPLHPWTVSPFTVAIKDPLVAGRVCSVFFGALTTVGMFLLGREFQDPKLGALAALLYVLCPYCLWYDRLAIAESMLLALFVFTIYFAVEAAKSVNLTYLVGTGVTLGAALLTKGTAQLLYPIVPFAYVLRGPREKGMEKTRPLVRWLLAVGLSFLLGLLIYNLMRLVPKYQMRSHKFLTRNKNPGEIIAHLGDFPRFIGSIFRALFGNLTPVLFALCLAGLIIGLAKKWRPSYFLLSWFLIGCFVIALVGKNTWPRFYLVLVPPLLFCGAYAICELLQVVKTLEWKPEGGRRRKGVAISVALIALFLAVAVPIVVEFEGMVTGERQVAGGRYISGHYSGIGLDKVVDFLEKEGRGKEISVLVNEQFVRLFLEAYLQDNPRVEITQFKHTPLRSILAEIKAKISRGQTSVDTYVVLNNVEGEPEGWPWDVIMKVGKAGEKGELFLILGKVR